jgi:hypothetical protein
VAHPSRLAEDGEHLRMTAVFVAGLRSREAWMREAMAVKTVANRRLTEELLEMANDMRASGLLSKASHEKIIKRHSGAGAKRASPESITTIGGYGFRACAKRRIPE